jgi:hypothetical protein
MRFRHIKLTEDHVIWFPTTSVALNGSLDTLAPRGLTSPLRLPEPLLVSQMTAIGTERPDPRIAPDGRST